MDMEKPERELAVEIADAVIHSVVDEGLLKDLPIIGSLINLANIGKSIPDRIFAKKVRQFVAALEKVKDLDNERFLGEIMANCTKRTKLSEVLVLTLDRLDDLEKVDYMACVFLAYVEQKLSFEQFRRLLHAIAESFSGDLFDFVRFMRTEAKHPLYLPVHLRCLTAVGLAFDSGASRPTEGIIPFATELGTQFSKVMSSYEQRIR